jgi:hypothetical protein
MSANVLLRQSRAGVAAVSTALLHLNSSRQCAAFISAGQKHAEPTQLPAAASDPDVSAAPTTSTAVATGEALHYLLLCARLLLLSASASVLTAACYVHCPRSSRDSR